MKHKKFSNLILKKSIVIVITILASIRIFIPIISNYITLIKKCFKIDSEAIRISNFYECIKVIKDNRVIGLIYIIIIAIISFTIYNVKFTKKQLKVEKKVLILNKKMKHMVVLILLSLAI